MEHGYGGGKGWLLPKDQKTVVQEPLGVHQQHGPVVIMVVGILMVVPQMGKSLDRLEKWGEIIALGHIEFGYAAAAQAKVVEDVPTQGGKFPGAFPTTEN